jgi:hypothetical protein
MIDFFAIRRRAESLQESSGLGTPEHAISQAALELLEALKRSVQTQKAAEKLIADRFVEIQKERDEARELHAKVCAAKGNPDEWEWLGTPGHFICWFRCAFRLHTRVNGGRVKISTIGEFYPDGLKGKMESLDDGKMFYETYVESKDGIETDGSRYATLAEAQAGHLKFCRKYDVSQKAPIEHTINCVDGYSFQVVECQDCGYIHRKGKSCTIAQNGAFVGPVPHE